MPKAKPVKEEIKQHGDPLADFDRHALDPEHVDPVPMPDNGGHPHSAAAHLGAEVHPHTKPEGNLRQGASPGQLRQPPMVQSRIGRQTRGNR